MLNNNNYVLDNDDFHNMVTLTSDVIKMKIKDDRKLISMSNSILPHIDAAYKKHISLYREINLKK